MKRFLKPEIFIIIVCCIVAFFIADHFINYIHDKYGSLDKIPLGEKPLFQFLRKIRFASLLVISSTLIIGGIAKIRRTGHYFSIVISVLGIALSLYWAGYNWFHQAESKSMIESFEKSNLKILEWGKLRGKRLHEPPTKDNVFLSKTYALLYYRAFGKSVDILTDKGEIIKYTPTKEDRDLSCQAQIAISNLRDTQISQLRSAILWSVNIPISILAGLLILYAKRKELSNQCMQSDAAEPRR